jgi:hypothetical protein
MAEGSTAQERKDDAVFNAWLESPAGQQWAQSPAGMQALGIPPPISWFDNFLGNLTEGLLIGGAAYLTGGAALEAFGTGAAVAGTATDLAGAGATTFPYVDASIGAGAITPLDVTGATIGAGGTAATIGGGGATAAGGTSLGGTSLAGTGAAGTGAGNIGSTALFSGSTGAGTAGGTSPFFESLLTSGAGAGSSGPLGNLFGSGLGLKDLFSIGSGLYGLYESQQQLDLAKAAFSQSNPFGPYRKQYADQLSQLIANPSSITSYPGYQFGFDQGNQALRASSAARGFKGSGNEDAALIRYGQGYAETFLGNEENMLANLAGAGISPNFGPALSGYSMGLGTASQSLASIGYGLGGSGSSTPIYIPGVGLVYGHG